MPTGYPEYDDKLKDFRIPSARYPGPNPNFSNIGQAQQGLAARFREQMPAMSDSLYNNVAKSARADLASNIAKNKGNYNSRGLLRSGMRQGAEYGLRGETEAALKAKRLEINQGLWDQLQDLENAQFNTEGNRVGLGPGLGGAALAGLEGSVQNEIGNMQAQQTFWSGLGSGTGSALGQLAYKTRGK